ncbi:unnamed protein product [Spirodela intermedia]|uniref:BHLH domain-containing protein n=1 Tax=Spirodela intermedia TaxID=51605 RepID=A0A7I8JDD0_SPIIN|nr:unnamed protein product [Spirodela intermedia]CAA6667392.1 unnamed protein product [Spirodela intermedia]
MPPSLHTSIVFPSPMAFLQRGDEGFPKNGEGSTSSSSFSSGNSILSRQTSPSVKMKAGKKRRREEQRRGSPSRRWSVKKEKLGQRIGELQRLVSPFGKSDTASVLHEALGYIRFLHDQVQVLSSPYLQRQPSSAHPHVKPLDALLSQELTISSSAVGRRVVMVADMAVGLAQDLRSRGLCLVPLAYTSHLVANNGADFWSPPWDAAAATTTIASTPTSSRRLSLSLYICLFLAHFLSFFSRVLSLALTLYPTSL